MLLCYIEHAVTFVEIKLVCTEDSDYLIQSIRKSIDINHFIDLSSESKVKFSSDFETDNDINYKDLVQSDRKDLVQFKDE